MNSKVETFEDLTVWKLCREFRQEVYDVTKSFPKEERYSLANQARRSAVSSTANIAEGFGRFHYQENVQFCRQSRGSLFETIDHLITSFDQEYIDEDRYEKMKTLGYRCVKVLNAYIASINKQKVREVK